MQLGLFRALARNCHLSLISATPIATYPKEKTIYVKKERIAIYNTTEYSKIPFINLFIIKHITQILSVYLALRRIPKNRKNTVIMDYNPYMELSIPTLLYAKIYQFKTVCIVADIPVTIPDSYNFVRKLLRRIEINCYYHFIAKYDALIVLNKNVITQFAAGKSYYLMDGGVSEDEIKEASILPAEEHYNDQILYTGALEPYNGIRELIQGFLQVDRHLTLIICGEGTLSSYVENEVEHCDRIIFKGKIPHAEATMLQRSCGLLISTRPTDAFALKLTFPSKLIEYMLSGTPILTTRLNGLGEIYEDKLFFCGQKPNEIASGISNFYKLPIEMRYERAIRARTYVENEKTYSFHVNGIVKLMKEILS